MTDGATTERSRSAPAPAARRKRRRKPRSANGRARRVVLYSVGLTFIVLGVLGLFLPILQGVLFLLIGVIVLAQVSPRARLWRQKLRARARGRYPRWTGKFEEAEARAKRWIARALRNNTNNDKRA